MATITPEQLKQRQKESISPEQLRQRQEERPRGLEETRQDISETVSAVGGQFKQAGENIFDTITDEDLTVGEKLRGAGSEAFRRSGRAFGESILGVGKVMLPESAENKIEDTVENVAEMVSEHPWSQSVMNKYNSLGPDTRREVDNALGFAEGLAEITTFGAAGRVSKETLKKTRETVNKAASKTKVSGSALVNKATPGEVRKIMQGLRAQDRDSAVGFIEDSYNQLVVQDKAGVKGQLDKLAARQKDMTREQLIRQLAEQDVPTVDGSQLDLRFIIEDLQSRQGNAAEAIKLNLSTVPDLTNIDSLRRQAKQSLKQTPQVAPEFSKITKQVDTFFDEFEEFFGKKELTAKEINQLRIEMNARTGAFKDEVFKQDAADAVADATRSRIDEIAGSDIIRKTNAEIGRLKTIEKTARLLNNKKVESGPISRTLGSFVGTVGAGAAGFQLAGPGAIVLAGMFARLGADTLADFYRSAAFSSKMKNVITDTIRQDIVLTKQLVDEASSANKSMMERMLLPEGAIRAPAPSGQSTPKVLPAKKSFGRNPKTGKFERVFTSEPKE